ncbi:glycosyltransferase family 4 protein [Streptococcus gordonii]|uniref:glycosyltransferase family 4 protein n=1 Tax=Streptococcus gordonii TaxID=1302 RepID=UPI00077972EB|nr:glycosyltransferase family 4 protein [Streptococcus gordonii]VTT24898.1 polysaccharide biosynthesis protein/putativeglycosyltransferase [Streptococcus gordonii]
MKILFVSPVGAMFSGAEVSIVNLMKLLVQQGHEVYNIIPDNAPHIDKDYLRHMDTTGIKLFQLKTNQWWWPESKALNISDLEIQAFQQKNIDEVKEIIQNEQIELVISNTVNVFQGAMAAACEKVRHIYIIHEFPFGEFGYYKELIPLIDDLSDEIFVVEGELYHTLTNYFQTDKLIPFIPYTEVQERFLKNSTISRFVSIGGINERKNQLELLAAYNQLNHKEIELVFIGGWDEHYKKLMDDYIEEHHLDHVSFIGFHSDPWSLVTDKDILVLPAKLETFSLVFVESVLNGVPAIISDNLGHLSSSKFLESGNLYSLGDRDMLSQKMATLIENFDTYKEKQLLDQKRARKKYTLKTIYAVFKDYIEVKIPIVNQKLSYKYDRFLGMKFKNRDIEVISKSQVVISGSNDGLHSAYHEITKERMENEDSIIFQLKNEKSLKILLSEFPGSYKKLSLVSLEDQREIPLTISNGITLDEVMVFLNTHPHILFDLSNVSGNQFLFSYEKDSDEEFSRHLFNLYENHKKLSHDYNSVIHSRRWTIPTKILKLLKIRK